MDAIKKGMDKFGGGSDSKAQGSSGGSDSKAQQSSGGSDQASGQKDDYVDKAFAAGAKKSGYNIDREQQEKITDAGRGAFEKASGKNIPDKFSN